MKHSFNGTRATACLISLIGMFHVLGAQDLKTMVRTYETLGGGAVFMECDLDGKELNNVKIPGKASFYIVRKVEGDPKGRFQVQFDDWPAPGAADMAKLYAAKAIRAANTALTQEEVTVVNNYPSYFKFNYDAQTGRERYFLLSGDDLELYARPLLGRLSPVYGAALLPFKLRRGGDFTKDISIAGLGGVRIHSKHRKFNLAVVGGIGLASVTLDSMNTEGTLTKTMDLSALTIPVGLVLEWDKLQFGAFVGWDNLNKRDRNGWIYQGDRWFAFGIGYTLFSEQDNSGKANAGSNSTP